MKKYLTIGNVLCAILAVCCLLLTAKAGDQAVNVKPLMEKAVVIEGGIIKPENEGKLVLVSGAITHDGSMVTDSEFDVTVATPMMVRIVEMYQWHEYGRENNKEIYPEWNSNIVNDSTFGIPITEKNNPKSKPYKDEWYYSSAHIGEFSLSSMQIDKITGAMINVTGLKQSTADQLGMVLHDNTYYLYNTSSKNVEIGDSKITFRMIDPAKLGNVTILAKQEGGALVDYTGAGIYPINLWYDGILSLSDVLEEVETGATTARVTGFALAFIFAGLAAFLTWRKIKFG